jgi:hypothetical protein
MLRHPNLLTRSPHTQYQDIGRCLPDGLKDGVLLLRREEAVKDTDHGEGRELYAQTHSRLFCNPSPGTEKEQAEPLAAAKLAEIIDPVCSRHARGQPRTAQPGCQTRAVPVRVDKVNLAYRSTVLLVLNEHVAGVRVGVSDQAGVMGMSGPAHGQADVLQQLG